jgi:alkylation response protein AidB-like acyl-CoA dehydrogenase
MQTDRARRQQRFLDIAAEHAEDFSSRVAQHDRENSFPFENLVRMKASGYTAIMAPEEVGGGGGDILDLVLAQERLARGDLPTAIAINMHHYGVGWLADLWHVAGRPEGRVRAMLQAVAHDQVIVGGGVSDPKMHSQVGFGGLNDTTRRAEKTAGGYIVNGIGKFSTLCACADFLFETAHYDDPDKGAMLLGFYLPKNTPGIKIQNNWDTLSIRASSSHDVVWENVFVAEESARPRPIRTWDTNLKLFSSWVPSMNACYLGMAQAAKDWAIDLGAPPHSITIRSSHEPLPGQPVSGCRNGDQCARRTRPPAADRHHPQRIVDSCRTPDDGHHRVPSVCDGNRSQCSGQGDAPGGRSGSVPLNPA